MISFVVTSLPDSISTGWLAALELLVSGFGPCSSKSGQGYPSSNETHGPKPMSNKLAEKPRGNYRGKSGLLVRCRISSINSMECKSHGILWLHGSSTCNGLLKSGRLPWRLISTYGNRPAWEGIKYIPYPKITKNNYSNPTNWPLQTGLQLYYKQDLDLFSPRNPGGPTASHGLNRSGLVAWKLS